MSEPAESFKPLPDLDEPMPDTWEFGHDQWIAATLIHQGKTQAQAGLVVDRERGTVANWKRKWVAVYGPEFLPLDGRIDIGKHRRPDLGGEAPLTWRAAREAIAANLGQSGDRARVLLERILDKYLADDDAVARLTIRDIERLSKTVLNLTTAADRLVGINNGKEQQPSLEGQGGKVPEGILGDLEQTPGEHDDLNGKLLDFMDKFERIKAEEESDPEEQ